MKRTVIAVGGSLAAKVALLDLAIRKTQRIWPLPRCIHDNCLKDGAGELLEPTCGCRYDRIVAHEDCLNCQCLPEERCQVSLQLQRGSND